MRYVREETKCTVYTFVLDSMNYMNRFHICVCVLLLYRRLLLLQCHHICRAGPHHSTSKASVACFPPQIKVLMVQWWCKMQVKHSWNTRVRVLFPRGSVAMWTERVNLSIPTGRWSASLPSSNIKPSDVTNWIPSFRSVQAIGSKLKKIILFH